MCIVGFASLREYIYVYACRYTYRHTSVFYVNGKFETGLMKLKTKDMFLNLM